MNLTDYKTKESFGGFSNVEDKYENISLPQLIIDSKPVSIDIDTSQTNRYVIYSLAEAIPDNSSIFIKNLAFYGVIDGIKKLINVSNNLTEKIAIDTIYSNPILKINIEFENDGLLYSINDEIELDTSKKVELQIKEQNVKYSNPIALIQALTTRIFKLENRIARLEKLYDNK